MFEKQPVPLSVVYDALSTLSRQSASGVLYISAASGSGAAFVIQDGEITKAGFDGLRGVDALDRLRQEEAVRFVFKEGDHQLPLFSAWPDNLTVDALAYLADIDSAIDPFMDAGGQAVERAHIMVVDDSAMVRNVVKHAAGRHGYAVVEVTDGGEVLGTLAHTLPDVILLDLVLPGMDGYSVLEQIRQTPALAHISVIILTSSDQQMQEARQGEYKANEYLHKPFQPDQLLTVLQRFIR